MIIWRGWGILAILFVPLGLAIGTGLNSLMSQDGPLGFGLGMLISAVGLYFFGAWFSDWDAKRRAAKYMTARTQEVNFAVERGLFQTAEYRPASMAEARTLAGEVLTAENEAVTRQLRNNHSLFFVPLRYCWILLALIGVGAIIASFTR